MSSDVVVCPPCGTSLLNSPALAGQIVQCPHCQTRLQMPALSLAALPVSLPPTIDSPQPNQQAADPVGFLPPAISPTVPASTRPGKRQPSVTDRFKKRTSPLAIFFSVVIVVTLIAVGTWAVLWERSAKAQARFQKQMVGNWELAPGQTQLDRWELAFHTDGKLQMALEVNRQGTLNDGKWRVFDVRGDLGYVQIEWPDDAPETMIVRLDRQGMEVELPSVGKFFFQEVLGP